MDVLGSVVSLNRRRFLSIVGGSLSALDLGAVAVDQRDAAEIAITLDDPKPDTLVGAPGAEINERILRTLGAARVRSALFVTGMRVDNAAGKALVAEGDARSHLIGNHSYSHLNYNFAGCDLRALCR
jgi:peptidoglycan/xylan/chitin deacetylase (PgdA/CDA1 family)